MKNKHEGSNFEDFLREEGVLEEIDTLASKRILAIEIAKMMEKQKISKSEMARRMHTQRNAVYNLLDPKKDCRLTTLAKAAKILGKRLKIELVSS